MSDLSKNQQSIDTSGAHVDGGDVEALRAKFEQRMLDDGWSAGELDWKGNHYAYPGIQDAWELYKAGHAAGVNKMVAAEVGEPVAWGWVDTMIGEGHRLMMVKINHHNDGVAVPLYTASQLAAAVAKERDRCLRIVESVDNHSNPMTANDCADAIRAGAKEREPQMPEGWAFYSADFSSNAADAFKPGSVLLTRTGRNRAAWLAMSEEDQEVNALYASGRGFTLDEAVRAAIHCVDAIRAGDAKEGKG